MESMTRFLSAKLKLKVNAAKSAVARPVKRKFLGFSFTTGKTPKLRLAPSTIQCLKVRVRKDTRRSCGRSLPQVNESLRPYLLGWRGYFGICDTPSVLHDLDGWIRRRLRSLVWKQ
jgi:RNA-directed DNA polymerase